MTFSFILVGELPSTFSVNNNEWCDAISHVSSSGCILWRCIKATGESETVRCTASRHLFLSCPIWFLLPVPGLYLWLIGSSLDWFFHLVRLFRWSWFCFWSLVASELRGSSMTDGKKLSEETCFPSWPSSMFQLTGPRCLQRDRIVGMAEGMSWDVRETRIKCLVDSRTITTRISIITTTTPFFRLHLQRWVHPTFYSLTRRFDLWIEMVMFIWAGIRLPGKIRNGNVRSDQLLQTVKCRMNPPLKV